MPVSRKLEGGGLSIANYHFQPYMNGTICSAHSMVLKKVSNSDKKSIVWEFMHLTLENTGRGKHLKVFDCFCNAKNSVAGYIHEIIATRPEYSVSKTI